MRRSTRKRRRSSARWPGSERTASGTTRDVTQFLAGKGNASSGAAGWSLFIENGSLVVRGAQVGGAPFSQSIAGVIQAGVWHNVVLVIDSGAGTIRGYLDGSNVDWIAGGGGGLGDTLVNGLSIENADPLLLGRRETAGAAFSGLIDDFAIWDRPLAAGEVADLHQNGLNGLDASNLSPPVSLPVPTLGALGHGLLVVALLGAGMLGVSLRRSFG